MELPMFILPEIKNEKHSSCPLCGSDEFDFQPLGTDGHFVTQVCPVCGLVCRVVVGPESPSMESLKSEWAAVFTHD